MEARVQKETIANKDLEAASKDLGETVGRVRGKTGCLNMFLTARVECV